MAAGRIVVPPYFPARDRNARLVPGALLAVYVDNTTNKAPIYTNEALNSPLANPVAANSSGHFPSIWCDAGTVEAPILYTLAISAPDGQSIGNPAHFTGWQPSVDAGSAQVALAESAAVSAAADLADILSIVASDGDTAAAVATRAAKAANGADFTSAAAVRDNLALADRELAEVDLLAARTNLLVPYRPSDDGALGNNAAFDTPGLQAFLDRGGSLDLTPPASGDYLLNDALSVSAGQRLTAEAGSTLKQVAGINGNLLVNAAYLAPWQNLTGIGTDVSWAAASYEIQVTWYDHGLQVGDWVWFDGATSGAYNGVFPVIEVINYANIKVRLRRRPTANPAAISGGTLRIKKADTDIVLDLRSAVFNYNFANNTDGAPGPQTHTIIMAGIHGLRLISPTFLDTKKFALCIVACADYELKDVRGYGLNSDLLKIYGPSYGVIDGLTGYPGDDFVSFHCREPDAFEDYRIGAGGDVDAKISRLNMTRGHVVGGSKSPMISIYPSANDAPDHKIKVEIDGVTGFCEGAAVQVLDYGGGATVESLIIRNVNASVERALSMAQTVGSVGNTTINYLELDFGCDYRNPGNADHITLPSTFVVDHFRISGRVNTMDIGGGSLLNFMGDIRVLEFDRLIWRVNAEYLVSGSGSKTTESIVLLGCDISVTAEVFRVSGADFTASPMFSVQGGSIEGSTLFEIGSTSTLSFNGVVLRPTTFVVSGITGDAPAITVFSEGSRLASGQWITAAGDATINPKSHEIVVNLNSAWLARATANKLTTSTAAGTVDAGAMVSCQGTAAGSWFQLNAPTTKTF